MKKWLAVALLCALVLISVGSVLYSASFEHMASQNGCVFSFGGVSQCITDIVGPLLLTQNALPVIIALVFSLIILYSVISLSPILSESGTFWKYRRSESFSSPYHYRLTRWLSLREHSPSTI